MKKLIMLIMMLFLVVSPVWGATTVAVQGNIIQISAIDTTVWYYTTAPATGPTFKAADYPNGLYIHHIEFHPGATNDSCTFRLVNASGVQVWHVTCADVYDDRTSIEFPPNIPYKLYFDSDDPNDNAVVIIHLR